ncbi:MAG: globin-coupled sensor protein [Hyphomicrobiales bacterium]|nr:globin-coupled sensor protein [Hyphomicrobiales bacterium]
MCLNVSLKVIYMSNAGAALSERLHFMQFNDRSRSVLRELSPLIESSIEAALQPFYGQIRETPALRALFKDERHIESAQVRQHAHWKMITSAEFDATYEKAVLTVGRTHARIGLEPRWYIGGYALIVDQLIKTIVSDRESTFLKRVRNDPQALGEAIGTLVKAAFLDMDVAISTYLDTLAEERRVLEEERTAVARRQTEALTALTASLSQLARGDLNTRLNGEIAPEFSVMRTEFNDTMSKLHEVIGAVLGSMHAIESGNQELAQASDDLARRTEQQAASLEETTAALAQITQGVKLTTDGVTHARTVASTATKDAAHTSEIVARSKIAMHEIETATGQIGKITDVIDEIAFQTNLLALNAGVEAARAGESGRGFAVVATEVRSLAQRASQSAKDIKSLIDHATSTVADGVSLVLNTEDALGRFVGQVQEITKIIGSIAETAQDQATGLSEVNIAIGDLDRATQQNAAMVEQSTAATQSLSDEASRLASQLSFFRTGASASSEPVMLRARKVERPAPAAPARPREKRVVNGRPQPAPQDNDKGWTEF